MAVAREASAKNNGTGSISLASFVITNAIALSSHVLHNSATQVSVAVTWNTPGEAFTLVNRTIAQGQTMEIYKLIGPTKTTADFSMTTLGSAVTHLTGVSWLGVDVVDLIGAVLSQNWTGTTSLSNDLVTTRDNSWLVDHLMISDTTKTITRDDSQQLRQEISATVKTNFCTQNGVGSAGSHNSSYTISGSVNAIQISYEAMEPATVTANPWYYYEQCGDEE